MASDSSKSCEIYPRRIGSWSEGRPGPLLLVVGGIHGNEPSGVFAARRVLQRLERDQTPLRGRIAALTGNLGALPRHDRYIESDMNRVWLEEEFVGTRRDFSTRGTFEARQRDELVAEMSKEIAVGWERVVVLDLHSTSAVGSPFCVMADTLKNRKLAREIRVPVILGLEETVSGTLIEYFCERGHVALCLEGGQHVAPETVDNHESALWIALVACGLVDEEHVPDLAEHHDRLRVAAGGVPGFVEVTHRHGIDNGLKYEMLPGFTNFQKIEKDSLLAHEGNGVMHEVRAPSRGLILMPRYQPQGDDGFFMTRPVGVPWLRVSALLRRLRLEGLLAYLPGVRAISSRPRTLRVNPKVARFFPVQLFHLFGYRHCHDHGKYLLFSRRVEGPADAGPEFAYPRAD